MQLKGEIFYLYAFDVADEIRTGGIHKILSREAIPYAIHRDHTTPKEIPFYRPLTIDLKRSDWKFDRKVLQPVIRIYDAGVVSIRIAVPFEVNSLKELLRFHRPILDNQHSLDTEAHTLCTEVVSNLQEYLVRGTPQVQPREAYTVFALKEIGEEKIVSVWTEEKRREIAGLLAETLPEDLSDQQVDEVFRYFLSFSQKDMIVIDWDAALMVDLAETANDVIYALEVANLQLEELVLMDQRVDRYLDRAYEELEKKQHPSFRLRHTDLAYLRRFRMNVAKITDEVSNISKFFGDWYLARVYLAARERFHLNRWRESIQDRFSNLNSLYEILHSEVTESRMLILEILIVLLFIIDLTVLLLKR